MSFYVAMRTKVKVKPEYIQLVTDYLDEKTWSELAIDYPFLEGFAKLDRADSVVESSGIFYPVEWKNETDVVAEIDKYQFEKTSPVWGIMSSVNYGHDVFKAFKDIVLAEIAEEVYLFEVLDEQYRD